MKIYFTLYLILVVIAVGLVLITHQLVELKRRQKLSGGRVVLMVTVEVPVNLEVVGDRFKESMVGYRQPTRAIAER